MYYYYCDSHRLAVLLLGNLIGKQCLGGHGKESIVGGGSDEGIRYHDRWTGESFETQIVWDVNLH